LAQGVDWRRNGVGRRVSRSSTSGETGCNGKFDEEWYAGEAVDTTVFEERGPVTKLKLTVLYESKQARDAAGQSGMERGMVASYNRLEALLALFAATA